MPLNGSQSSGVPVRMSPISSSSEAMRLRRWSASSTSASGPRRLRVGLVAVPISTRARASQRGAGGGRRKGLDSGGGGGADQIVAHTADLTQPRGRVGAHHDEFAGTERTEQLVGMVEEAADATRQRPEGGGVAASDEADRPIDGLADGQCAEDRGEREASRVDDDQRPLVLRKMLVAADRHVPADLGETDDLAHETGVAAPVVDHACRFVDEPEGQIDQTTVGRHRDRSIR